MAFPTCLPLPVKRDRLIVFGGAMLITICPIILGLERTWAADATYNDAPTNQAGDTATAEETAHALNQNDETFFAPVLSDLESVLASIADVPAMTRHMLEGGSPHLLLFIEGNEPMGSAESPVIESIRAVAGNHQLAMEFQSTTLKDGSPLFGVLLYQRFPTLEFAWETHPYEAVASEDGAWSMPFADLSDVESVHLSGERATLVLSAAAAQRIDALSALQGHRTYRVRGVEMLDGGPTGRYTWIPGLRSVPGLSTTYTCRLPRRGDQWKEGISLDYLRQRFAVHAIARARIQAELGLPDLLTWTLPMVPPRFTEPFFCWIAHAPENGGEATPLPWFANDSGRAERWLLLQDPATPTTSAAIPSHWDFGPAGAGAGFLPCRATSPLGTAQEEAFGNFLRQNLGREMAVVMQGHVAGVLTIESAHPDVLPLGSAPSGADAAIGQLWNVARTGRVVPAQDLAESMASIPAPKPVAPVPMPDTFQIRLMAEPQDRELVSVTHFAAPGSPPGVVVAVQDGIILDGRAVTGVHRENKDDKLFLRLTFTPEAQEALGGACFGNMGKQLAIVYKDRLLCAPTIDDWEIEELSFKGMDQDWPDVAEDLMRHLGEKG